ncbi:hypothetical protein DSO57_1003446 [Entomophthora muscae]|uniref:Uncharacterized protein n=1 Tax=Entomophthora muscae TaxID=34485 RepID=A0ACC2UID8_9FUNG|nr:hypothetical protein DSO57_1003446 [Entomophthora muscae]
MNASECAQLAATGVMQTQISKDFNCRGEVAKRVTISQHAPIQSDPTQLGLVPCFPRVASFALEKT